MGALFSCCKSDTLDDGPARPVEMKKLPPKASKNGGHVLGGASASSGSESQGEKSQREAILAAAEKRAKEAQNRGVQKGGGKLARQLQQKNDNSEPPSDNLMWRAD
ncbi:uncharacterized protein VTP21DRAFT_4471 [Calcarisporiella thermophila]|uniref:uncharacterized protein n=1 Tax=Calcarisporiella thermophila TaxID=911321 RepID=UPI003741F492